jgi:hypothetical protein
MARFVKARDTSTSVGTSRAQLETLLMRYGCSHFGTASDFKAMKASVSFQVPDSPAHGAVMVPVRLEVDVAQIAEALYERPRDKKVYLRGRGEVIGFDDKELARAERVAWRHLVLWVDAACSAATAGLQTMSEAFFAHVLVKDDRGKVRRMVEHLDHVAPGGHWKALLTDGSKS